MDKHVFNISSFFIILGSLNRHVHGLMSPAVRLKVAFPPASPGDFKYFKKELIKKEEILKDKDTTLQAKQPLYII